MEVLQNLFLQHLHLVFDKEIKCKGIEVGIEGNVLKYVTTAEYRNDATACPWWNALFLFGESL